MSRTDWTGLPLFCTHAPSPQKRKTPANPYPQSTRSTHPENPYDRSTKKPRSNQSTSSSGPKPTKSPRQQRASSRDDRESEEARRREQARRDKEAEERRRAQEREEKNQERTGRQADQAAKNKEEETRKRRKIDKELDQQARSREPRLESAWPRFDKDRVTQLENFGDRALKPTHPATNQEPDPTIRYPHIALRPSPAERELKEAKRAHEIARATAAAVTALADAKTATQRTAALKLEDEARASARRDPALPYRALASCDQFTHEAFDGIYPPDIFNNYFNFPRHVSESDMAQFATIIGRMEVPLTAATEAGDFRTADRYTKFILAAPLLFFRHSPNSILIPQIHTQTRLSQFFDGRFGELIEDFNRDVEIAENKARNGISPHANNSEVTNVLRLTAQGEYSKALQHLDSKGVHDAADPEVLRQLKEKLGKPRQQEIPGRVDDDGRPFGDISINVKKTFRNLKANKGTGPDNVPSEFYVHVSHHRPACDEANAAMDVYSFLGHQYVNGRSRDWYYAMDAHTETVALAKSAFKIDVRPISMSATLSRAWKAAAVKPSYVKSELNFGFQFGAGTKSGGQAHAIGAGLSFELQSKKGGLIMLDIANAYSETCIARALEKVKSHPDDAIRNLYPLLLATYSPNRTPKGIDMHIETGVAQGCPLSSILFAVAIHPSLQGLRELTGNSATAYQDDTVVPTADFAKTLPQLVEYSEKLEKEVGIRLNPEKCTLVTKNPDYARSVISQLASTNPAFFNSFHIGCTPEVDADNVQWGGGVGTMINGAPIGDDVFTHYQMDKLTNKTIAAVDRIAEKLGSKSIQASMLLLRSCVYPAMSHSMSIVKPTISELYLERIDDHLLSTFKSLCHIDSAMLHLSENETFAVEARLWLPIKHGGIGLTPLKSIARAAFCAAHISAIPRLVERVIEGVVYKAAIPELEEFIGGYMGDKETHLRFARLFSEATMSKFPQLNALVIAYAHLQHQAVTGLYNISSRPEHTPTTGFLSSPFEGLGRDASNPQAKLTTRLQAKLHAPIIEDYLTATRVFVETELDRRSKVREAFLYTEKYASTKHFLTATPSRKGAFSNTDMQTAICSYLGLPIPLCLLHRNIRLPSGNDQLHLDIYGDNIAKATHISGPANTTRHNNILHSIADCCKQAGAEFSIEDTTSFAAARDPRSDSHLPPIIPDILLSSSYNEKLFDVKVVGPGTSWFRDGTEKEALERRAARVPVEYERKAYANDQAINSNLTKEILESLGGAVGLVCGPRGEYSKSLDVLTLSLAENAAKNNWNLMGAESIQEAKGKIKNTMRRTLATIIVKEQSKWMRTRIKQAIADRSGGPKFGERARHQSAQAQREQAEYAEAHASFARGPRGESGRWGRRNDGNMDGETSGNRAGNPNRTSNQGEDETESRDESEGRTESDTGSSDVNGSGDGEGKDEHARSP